jgi:DNA-binding response OmpR family regulator
LKILAIDDNPDLTELLEVSLNAMGHEINVTNDATEGLALATSSKYDIVLLDINMPKFTGIDFVNTLVEKNLIQNHNIVLFTSSSTSSSEVSELLKKGVRGCIEKPIEVDVLEKEINKYVSKSPVMDSEESTKIFGKLKDDSQKELFLKFLIDFSSGKIEELEIVKQELQKEQYDKLLIVLADDVSRKIIEILTKNELSHLQISKKLKIPQTTTYRKIKKLEELTLIKKSKVVRNLDGTEESYYTSWVSEIGIKIKDGKVSYNFEKIKLDEKIKRILE